MICKENIIQVLNFPNGQSPECSVHQRIAQRLRDSAPPLLRPVSDFQRGYLTTLPAGDDEDVSMDEDELDEIEQDTDVTDFEQDQYNRSDMSDEAVKAQPQEGTTESHVPHVTVDGTASSQPQYGVPSLARFNAHHYVSIPLPEISPPSTPTSDGTADSLSTLSPIETTDSNSSFTRASSLAASIPDGPPSSKVSVAGESTRDGESDRGEVLVKEEEEEEKQNRRQWLPKRSRHRQRAPIVGQAFPCLIDDCGLELTGPRERLRHMDTHFAHLSLFQCPGCNDFMARSDSLKRHCDTVGKTSCYKAALEKGGNLSGVIEWRRFCILESGHWFWEREHIHRVRVPPPGDPLVEVRAEIRKSFGLDPYA